MFLILKMRKYKNITLVECSLSALSKYTKKPAAEMASEDAGMPVEAAADVSAYLVSAYQ